MNGIHIFIKKHHRGPLYKVKEGNVVLVMNQKELSTQQAVQSPDLGLPSHGNVRNKYLLFRLLSLCIYYASHKL